jgi:hypothetical protein
LLSILVLVLLLNQVVFFFPFLLFSFFAVTFQCE